MDKEKDFWFDDDKKVLVEAMLEAEKRFKEYINDELGLDGAYWDIELTGYVLSSHDFSKMEKVEMGRIEDDDDTKM